MSSLPERREVQHVTGIKAWLARMQMAHGRKLVIALPYLWLILLFMLPFLIVFKISLAEMARAIPPYTDLVSVEDSQLSIMLNLANFLQLTDDPLYFEAYLQSLQVAGISTLCCLLLGYPLAWAVAHSSPSTRNILLLLVILPSWTSFLIRVYAWMGILKENGVISNATFFNLNATLTGRRGKLKSGDYTFAKNMSNGEALDASRTPIDGRFDVDVERAHPRRYLCITRARERSPRPVSKLRDPITRP